MSKTEYAKPYRGIDFRKEPTRYRVGRGEQGVLIAEPYKSEILPHWRFATPEVAEVSAQKIYSMFKEYRAECDFVGMDMARKFLQMGFTRSRRYANHSSGKKYDVDGSVRLQDTSSEQSDKAKSARIFYALYVKAKDDPEYKRLAQLHKEKSGQ